MKRIFLFTTLFFFIELFGLFFSYRVISLYSQGFIQPMFVNRENPANSLYLFLAILISTFIFILILKFKKHWISYLEATAVFVLVFYAFYFYLDFIISLLLSFVLTLWSMKKPNWINKNLCLILSIYSSASLVGVSLGVMPALLFGIILAIYDFVSVFITKHMVYLAKSMINRPTSFLLRIPTKKPRTVSIGPTTKKLMFTALGGGDLFIPLTFSVSLLSTFGFKPAFFSILFSSITFFLMLLYQHHKNRPSVLPALPFIFLGSVSGFLLSLML